MTTTPSSLNILVVGGNGRVARLATPKLTAAGHAVTSLIRDPDQAPGIRELGAEPLLQDLTELSPAAWATAVRPFDVVVWSAGNGGKAGPEATTAIDRDGALALVEGLESLGSDAPRLVMVSYLGATTATAEDDGGSWYAYVEAKKAVDLRLLESDLDVTILGPGRLTDEPAGGIHRHEPTAPAPEASDTSRDLVAEVIAWAVTRTDGGVTTVEFVDGDDAVDTL